MFLLCKQVGLCSHLAQEAHIALIVIVIVNEKKRENLKDKILKVNNKEQFIITENFKMFNAILKIHFLNCTILTVKENSPQLYITMERVKGEKIHRFFLYFFFYCSVNSALSKQINTTFQWIHCNMLTMVVHNGEFCVCT